MVRLKTSLVCPPTLGHTSIHAVLIPHLKGQSSGVGYHSHSHSEYQWVNYRQQSRPYVSLVPQNPPGHSYLHGSAVQWRSDTVGSVLVRSLHVPAVEKHDALTSALPCKLSVLLLPFQVSVGARREAKTQMTWLCSIGQLLWVIPGRARPLRACYYVVSSVEVTSGQPPEWCHEVAHTSIEGQVGSKSVHTGHLTLTQL